MTKTTCLLRTFACLSAAVVPASLNAQELIANGNFESAALSPWEVSAPAGTIVATVNESSPYTSRYPAGTRAIQLQDDDSEFETPFFKQAFAAQSGIKFSFDFKAPAAAPGTSWHVLWMADADPAFFFSIGGQSGASIDLNQTPIANLEAGMWYHVEGTASAPGQIVSGSLLNARGERISFSGGFPFGVQSAINGLTVTDGDQARNETVVFDNFSAEAAVIVSAVLTIEPAPNGNVTVSWTAAGYNLQASNSVGPGAQWTNIQTSGQTYTTSPEQPMQFFRLVAN